MKIEHVAIWVRDLEKMKSFYEQYFDGKSNDKYYNATKGFESYFITFEDGARLEIMRKTGVDHSPQINITGWAHVAFSVGSKALVNEKTEQLMHAGYEVVGQPRLTGDGYYESVIKDPEGNLVEISM
ncbi:VOC family protein [Paenibacillus polymyxa]|uniref:VOC family protein n=1 Tax=Paenibacillus TaxID=44249 RepID=UPI002024EF02|nr:VOC family protein [Paenibacillus polymyxa]MDQ0050645.1 lactoylglutathione lyase [Paenibacillus polymyxa]URJ62483.1 VOC family protein [Paenibacillus polymyxa]